MPPLKLPLCQYNIRLVGNGEEVVAAELFDHLYSITIVPHFFLGQSIQFQMSASFMAFQQVGSPYFEVASIYTILSHTHTHEFN